MAQAQRDKESGRDTGCSAPLETRISSLDALEEPGGWTGRAAVTRERQGTCSLGPGRQGAVGSGRTRHVDPLSREHGPCVHSRFCEDFRK